MADAHALGACAARRVGSSPTVPTNTNIAPSFHLYRQLSQRMCVETAECGLSEFEYHERMIDTCPKLGTIDNININYRNMNMKWNLCN